MALVIETRRDPVGVGSEAEAAIHALDPNLPVFEVRPVAGTLTASMALTTFTGWMLAGAAGMALLPGIVGIYGVVAYTVSLRPERLACGWRWASGRSRWT